MKKINTDIISTLLIVSNFKYDDFIDLATDILFWAKLNRKKLSKKVEK